MKKPSRRRKPIPNDPVVQLVRDLPQRAKGSVNPEVLARSRAKPVPAENAFVLPTFPKSVIPKDQGKGRLAMDTQIIEVNAWASQNLYAGAFNNGATFLGYPYLSQLSQIPEYRKIVETTAMHMTRKFITLQAAGSSEDGAKDKSEKIKEITDDLENFKVRDVFRKAAEVDGYFGRAHLYIDLGYAEASELRMPIGNGRDALSRMKMTPGTLKGFKVIEPVWTYPGNYNSNDPFDVSWYNPQTWFVMQREIHHSRLLRMVGREVSDLLKPAYSFGGLSLSQLAKPYVDNWLRTRQSVADLIWSFSTSGVMTDMQTTMAGDGQALFDRAELFNNLRNNRGMMLLNKDSEEFFQVNTPLGTLDKLQAQAQEQMASVSSIPLVFLLGITPSGLNASSEGEIRAFYDFIHAFQTKFFTEPLTRVIDFIQLNRYGVIDPEITFIFEPLWSMTEKEMAEVDKTSAETDDLRINGGVISPLEARKRVANAPETPYANLDVTVIPVPPGSDDTDGDGEPDPNGAPPVDGLGGDDDEGGGGDIEGAAPRDEHDEEPFGKDTALAQDEGFKEDDHPRGQPDNSGQFGAGGGGGESGGEVKNEVVHNATHGVYHVKHKGELVMGKVGNKPKQFMSPEAAKKFSDTYTGESAPATPKEKKAYAGPGISKGEGFKQVKNLAEYLDVAKAAEKDLTPEERQALSHYTSPAYAPLNKALRGDKKLSPETQKIVDTLDKVISDSTLPEALTLFRGLRGGKVREMLDNLMPGDTLTDKGFVSTSLTKSVSDDQSEGGSRTTMVIRAPKGSNAAFPGEHSFNQSEASTGHKFDNALEAVLPRGSQFKFVGKKGATYEFEYVSSNKGAQDEAKFEESKHPRGQPGIAGQFGSGGGGSSGSGALATAKQVTSILGKAAGISGKYRQGIQNLLKDSSVSAESKTKLKHKLIESYKAKAAQLHKIGDTSKSQAVAAKASKLEKAMGVQSVPIKKTPADYAKELAAEDPVAMGVEGKPSAAELAQAKKTTALPNYSNTKAIAKFNDKWADKAVTDEQAVEKIADFKKMQAEKLVEQKATQEEAEATAKEESKKAAEKLVAEMNDPEVAKHYAVLATIAGGLNESRKKHLNGKIKSAGLEGKINAVDCALIQAYTGSDYGPVNKQMREGVMNKKQFGYAKSLQQALLKLPKFEGIVKRGTNLPAEVFAKYKPGYIVPERAFTSTGEGYKFSGTHTYEIQSIGGRDVRNISSQGPGEQEVIFPAGSHFEVISVEGQHIKMREVEGL